MEEIHVVNVEYGKTNILTCFPILHAIAKIGV